jgi:hypothetical protein
MLGQTIDVAFSNGNTAASPTITIGSVTYTITGLPTVAQLQAGSTQTYKLKKTGATTMAFVDSPGYITESGQSGDFKYLRFSNGVAECFMTASQSTATLTMTQISTSAAYYSQDLFLALPTGLFNNASYTALMTIFSRSYVINLSTVYDVCTANSLGFVVIKNGSSTSAVSFRARVIGTWK